MSLFDYKLVCVDDQFTEPFKSNLGRNAVHKFIISMIVIKKHFNNKIVMTKKDHENFKNNTFVENDFKVRRYHFHVIGKNRGNARSDCNIKVSLNYKIPIGFAILEIALHIVLCKNFENSVLK